MGCGSYSPDFYELVEGQRSSTDFKEWLEDFFNADDANNIIVAIENGDWNEQWESPEVVSKRGSSFDRVLGDGTALIKTESEKSLLSFYSTYGMGTEQGSTAVRNLRRKFRREIVNRLVYNFEDRLGIKSNVMTPTGNKGSKLLYQFKIDLLKKIWTVTGKDYSSELKENDVTFTNIVSQTIQDYQTRLKSGDDTSRNKEIYDTYVMLVQFDNLLSSEINFIKIKDVFRKGTSLGVDMYDYVGATMKRDSSYGQETASTSDYTGSIVKLLLDEMFPIHQENGEIINGEFLTEDSFNRAMSELKNWLRYSDKVDSSLKEKFLTDFSEFDISEAIDKFLKHGKRAETSNDRIIRNTLYTIKKYIFTKGGGFSQEIIGSFKRHVKDNYSQVYDEYGFDLSEGGILPSETTDFLVKRQARNVSKIVRSQVNMWVRKPDIYKNICESNNIVVTKESINGVEVDVIKFNDGVSEVTYKLTSTENKGIVTYDIELVGSKNSINQLDLSYCIKLLRQVLGLELPIGYEGTIKDVLKIADNSISENNFIMALFGEIMALSIAAGSTKGTRDSRVRTFNFKLNKKTKLLDTYLYNKYLNPIAKFFTLEYGQDSVNVIKNQEGNSLPLYTVGSLSKKTKEVIYSARRSNLKENPYIRVPQAIKSDSVRGQVNWGGVIKSSKDLRMSELLSTLPVLDYFYGLTSKNGTIKLSPITTSDKSTHPLYGIELSEFSLGDTTAKDILKRISQQTSTAKDLQLLKDELVRYRGGHAKSQLKGIVEKYIDVFGLKSTGNLDLDIIAVNKELKNKKIPEVRQMFIDSGYDFNEVLYIDTDFNGNLSLNQELLEEHLTFNTNKDSLDNYLDAQRRMFAEDMHANRFLINLNVFKNKDIESLAKKLGSDWVDSVSKEMKPFIIMIDGKVKNISWASPIPSNAKIILNPIYESYFWASTIYGSSLGDLLAGHTSSYKKATWFYKENKNKVIAPLNELANILKIKNDDGSDIQLVASSSYEEIQQGRVAIINALNNEISVLGNIESVKATLLSKGISIKTLGSILFSDNISFNFDSLLKLNTNGIPTYDVLDERAFRTITKAERVKEKTKRALFIGSTVTSPIWGDPGVPPKEVNVACIKDLPAFAYNLLGQQHNKESHDGCGFVAPSFARGTNKGMYDAAVGDAVRKTIAGGLYADTGSFWEIKWAEMVVNNIMRSQTFDESEFSMEMMFKMMHDTQFSIVDKQTLSVSDFYGKTIKYNSIGESITHTKDIYFLDPKDGKYYKIISIEEDVDNLGDVKRTIVEVQKKESGWEEVGIHQEKPFTINNLYDIDQLFGGCFCKQLDNTGQLITSDANEEILYKVISERNLWKYLTSIVVNQSGMKVGQMNVNESIINDGQDPGKQTAYGSNARQTIFSKGSTYKLNTFKVAMDFYGAIMDADHELQNATIREANQLISALMQDDNNYEIVSRIYHDIGEVAYRSLKPFFDAMELYKQGDPTQLFEKIGKAVMDAYDMRNQDDIGLAYAFLDNIDENVGHIPFSTGSISSVALSSLGSTLTKLAIKTDYPGSGSVQVPSNGFMKVYTYRGNVYNYEGLVEEIVKTNAMAGTNIDVQEAFTNPGDLKTNPFVVELFDDTDPTGKLKIEFEDTIIEEDIATGSYQIIKVATPETRDYYRNRKVNDGKRYYRWELKSRDLLPPQMTYIVNGQTFSVYDLDPVRVHTYIRMLTGKYTLLDTDKLYMETFVKNYAISRGLPVSDILTKNDFTKISEVATKHLKKLLSTFSKIKKGQTTLLENQSAFGLPELTTVVVSNLNMESGQIIAGKAFMDLFDLVDSDQMSDILSKGSVFFRERLKSKYSFPKNSAVDGTFYDGVIYTRSGEKILVVRASKDEYGNWNDNRLDKTNDYIGLDFETAKGKVWYKSERGDEEICSEEHLKVKSIHTTEGTFTVLVVDDLNVLEDISATGITSHIRYNINESNYEYVAPYIDAEYSLTGNPSEIVRILRNTEYVNNISVIDNLAEERWIAFQKSINYVGTRIPAQSMQSFMPLKVVAFTSSIKNEVYVPFALTWAAGSDYDIDKLYLMGYSIRKDGTLYTNTHLGAEYNISQRLKLPRGMGREFKVGDNGVLVTNADLDAFFKGKDLTKFNECLRNGSTIITFEGNPSEDTLSKDQSKFLKQLNKHENHKMTPSQEDGALKNSVVERIIDVLHDPKNMINMLKPVSADSLKKVAEKSPIGKRELTLNLDTPSVIMLMQYQNMLGKTGIASSATGLKAYFGELTYYAKKVRELERALRQVLRVGNDSINRKLALKEVLRIVEECAFNSPLTNALSLISNINPEEMFDIIDEVDDSDFWKVDHPLTKLNYGTARVGNIIDVKEVIKALGENSNRNDCPSNDSEVLTASTDNAKDPILGKINAFPATIDLWTYLFSTGESIDDVAEFMSSKVMRTICAFIDTNVFGSNERFNTLDSCVKFVNDESPLYIQDYLWTDLIILDDNSDKKKKDWDGIVPTTDSLLDFLLYSDRVTEDKTTKKRVVRPGVEKMLRHFGINWNGIINEDVLTALYTLIHGEYKGGRFFTKIMSTYYGEDYDPRTLLLDYLRIKAFKEGFSSGYEISDQDFEDIERARVEAELAAEQARLDNPEIGNYIEEDEKLPDPVLLYKYVKNFFVPKCEMLMERLGSEEETFDADYFKKIDEGWAKNVDHNLKLLVEKILPGVKEQQLVGKSLSNNKGLATTDFEEYNWIAQYEKRVNQIYLDKLPIGSAEVFVFEKFMTDEEYRIRQKQQMQKCRVTFNVLDVFTSVEHFWKRAHAISLLRGLTETIGVFKLERKFEREVLRKNITPKIMSGQERLPNVTKNHTYVMSNLGWTKLRHFTKEIIIQNWFMLQKDFTFDVPSGESYWTHSTATKATVNASSDPKTIDLSTYNGQKSFKLLMESYIIPKMKLDPNFAKESFVQRLIPTEVSDFTTGEVMTYYKYPFPLRKGRDTSKYNTLYDEVLISFNKIAQKSLRDYGIGDWKIGELFFVYNLIIHRDAADADSFNELFTDLTIANNPLKLIKSYYDFIASIDSNTDKLVYDINDLKLMLVGTSDEFHVFDKDLNEYVSRKNGTVKAYTTTDDHEFGNKTEDDTGNLYFITHSNSRAKKYKKQVDDSESFKDSRIRTYSPKLDDLSTKRAIVKNLIKVFNYRAGVSVELLNTDEIKERFKDISKIDQDFYNRLVSEKAFIHEGVVYINEDTMSIESPVHEFMHLVCAAMKFGPNPQRYYSLLRKVADDPEIRTEFADEINSISEDKRNLTDYREEILVKVLAGYFGKRFKEEWYNKVGEKLTSVRAEEFVEEIVKTIFGTNAVPNNYSQSLSDYLINFNSSLFDLSDSWQINILQSQKLKAIRTLLIKTNNLEYTGDC